MKIQIALTFTLRDDAKRAAYFLGLTDADIRAEQMPNNVALCAYTVTRGGYKSDTEARGAARDTIASVQIDGAVHFHVITRAIQTCHSGYSDCRCAVGGSADCLSRVPYGC